MERWKPVVGYEGLYEVSDLGRVRNVAKRQGTKPGKLLTPLENDKGYISVRPHLNGKGHTRSVHGLVAAAFIGDRPRNFDIDHLDGDKKNNNYKNLEYVPHQENIKRYFSSGRVRPYYGDKMRGELNKQATTSDRLARKIKTKLMAVQRNKNKKRGDLARAIREITKKINVSKRTCENIASGRSYKWL